MEYVRLERTGLKVSWLCLGMMTLGGGSEELIGQALKEYAPREAVIIATKVFNAMSEDVNDRGLSPKHIMDSIDRSLQRLETDYADLYIIHRWDYETPLEETMEALHDVVKAGKARYIGASSMYAWQFALAMCLKCSTSLMSLN